MDIIYYVLVGVVLGELIVVIFVFVGIYLEHKHLKKYTASMREEERKYREIKAQGLAYSEKAAKEREERLGKMGSLIEGEN